MKATRTAGFRGASAAGKAVLFVTPNGKKMPALAEQLVAIQNFRKICAKPWA